MTPQRSVLGAQSRHLFVIVHPRVMLRSVQRLKVVKSVIRFVPVFVVDRPITPQATARIKCRVARRVLAKVLLNDPPMFSNVAVPGLGMLWHQQQNVTVVDTATTLPSVMPLARVLGALLRRLHARATNFNAQAFQVVLHGESMAAKALRDVVARVAALVSAPHCRLLCGGEAKSFTRAFSEVHDSFYFGNTGWVAK